MVVQTDARASTFGAAGSKHSASAIAHGHSPNNSEFPAGLRVLVVDDDPIFLLILDRMLRQCLYKVTTCERAAEGLKILRENKDGFDLVISDVHMPDMDGFKLLELVGLEMDLPVIMISANGETSAVMKGIKHGACDYLLKPVRIEELKNIWQHVVRKKARIQDMTERLGIHHPEESRNFQESGLDAMLKSSKRRKDAKDDEEDAELENDDPATSKKPRVVWSVELHQKFVSAVNQLGLDKAVPKRILELMDVHGLTRENVASHLQKYRLYLKRVSGVPNQVGVGAASFMGFTNAIFGGPRSGMLDLQAHLTPQVYGSGLPTQLYDQVDDPCNPFIARRMDAHDNVNYDGSMKSSYGGLAMHRSIVTPFDFKRLEQGVGHMVPFSQSNKEAQKFPQESVIAGTDNMGVAFSNDAKPLQLHTSVDSVTPCVTHIDGDIGAKLTGTSISRLGFGQGRPALSLVHPDLATANMFTFSGSLADARNTPPVDSMSISSIACAPSTGSTIFNNAYAIEHHKSHFSSAQSRFCNSPSYIGRKLSMAGLTDWQGWHGGDVNPSVQQDGDDCAALSSEYDDAFANHIGASSTDLDNSSLIKPIYSAIPPFGQEQHRGENDLQSRESAVELMLGQNAGNAVLDAVPLDDYLTSNMAE